MTGKLNETEIEDVLTEEKYGKLGICYRLGNFKELTEAGERKAGIEKLFARKIS